MAGGGIARRPGLLDEVDPEELAALAGEVSAEAWKQVSIIHKHLQGKNGKAVAKDGKGENPMKMLTVDQKQRAIIDWLSAMVSTEALRCQTAKAALLDPLAFLRIWASMVPKKMEISVNPNEGLLLLPAKMGIGQEWMDMASGMKPIDETVLESEEAVELAHQWRPALGTKVELGELA